MVLYLNIIKNKKNLAIGESSSEILHGSTGDGDNFESDVEDIEHETEESSDDEVGQMETETETSDTETDEDTSVPSQRQGKDIHSSSYIL